MQAKVTYGFRAQDDPDFKLYCVTVTLTRPLLPDSKEPGVVPVYVICERTFSPYNGLSYPMRAYDVDEVRLHEEDSIVEMVLQGKSLLLPPKCNGELRVIYDGRTMVPFQMTPQEFERVSAYINSVISEPK